jgi:hypothetical protein
MDEIQLLDLASGVAHFNAPPRHIANQYGNNDTRGLDQCATAVSGQPALIFFVARCFPLEVIMRWSVVVVTG